MKIIKISIIFILLLCAVGCNQAMTDQEILERAEQIKQEQALNNVVEDIEPLEAIEAVSQDQSETVNPTLNKENDDADDNTNSFDEADTIENLEVQTYYYVSSIDTPWVYLAVKNNSEYNLNIEVNLLSYDKEGNLIGSESSDQDAFETGTEILLTYMLDENPYTTEYRISLSEEDDYECVVSDLKIEATNAKKKVIVAITNESEFPAEFVEANILFFDDEAVVGHDNVYYTDDDYELKPNNTIIEELKCYDEYEDYKIFLTGKR
jgi:hypothetical protein